MTDDHTPTADQVEQVQEALADARSRIGDIPVEQVVLNHAMGLYELAAIHLSANPPRLFESAFAIDALACLVEGLGPRLGDDHTVMMEALSNIRLAFVQIKAAQPG